VSNTTQVDTNVEVSCLFDSYVDGYIKKEYIDPHKKTHILRIINASHAESMHKYMNSKPKVLNCNANMYKK
jgi:hypothetical protein